jgi:PilZ domain
MENCRKAQMATEKRPPERRREGRFPVKAAVIVRKASGETVRATAVDISSSGMRLCLEKGTVLVVGEQVTVDVELPELPHKPWSAWGFGRVAYVDATGAGIQLFGGQFDPLSIGD